MDTSTANDVASKATDVAAGGIDTLLAWLISFTTERYWQHGGKGLGIVLFGIWFAGYFVFAMGLMIPLLALSPIVDLTGSAPPLGAIASLGFTGWVGYRAYSGVSDRKQVLEYQQTPTPDAAASVVPMLDSADGGVRSEAAFLVADVAENGGPGKIVKAYGGSTAEIVEPLVELLEDDTRNARVNAAAALKFFARDYPEAVVEHREALIAALAYRDSDVQIHAAIAVGNLAFSNPALSEEVLEPLLRLLDDEDHQVRSAACLALGHVPDDRAIDPLRRMADDPNPEVVEQAHEALGMHQERKGAKSSPEQSADQGPSPSSTDDEGEELEFVEEPPEMDFDDVAGMEELKSELERKVIEPFEGDEVFEKYGVAADSGILFHGPPGTGKTYMARALAGELDVNYVGADVGDIESKWLGEGVENIKAMFEEARDQEPTLVFIDEVDALASDRSSGNQHDDKKKMVNQLLQEMSDLEDEELVVIAATNNPDSVDDAMMRTGRFDSKIEVPPPGEEARVEIFEHHMNAPAEEIDTDRLARETSGFVASDMAEVARRAALAAAGREQETGRDGLVTEDDVFGAIEELSTEKGSIGEFVSRPPDVDFDDVVGMEGLKSQLEEKVIDPLSNPEFHEQYGLGVEHGFLLYGPPGTGKTHMARCLAGELDVNYVGLKAGDVVSKYIGEGAQNVQKLFDEARANQPCLVFVDEIEALASNRGGNQSKSERQMVNQFLEEMSSLNDEDDDVIVVAATNRLDDVDDAMLRTGRFTETIEVPPPGPDARVGLFEHHLDAPSEELERDRVAELTEGFVASDMVNLADRAARKAMRRARDGGDGTVGQADVEEAITELRNRGQPAD